MSNKLRSSPKVDTIFPVSWDIEVTDNKRTSFPGDGNRSFTVEQSCLLLDKKVVFAPGQNIVFVLLCLEGMEIN